MTEDYADLQKAIEAAGFFTTFQPIEKAGDRIVCASHQFPDGHERPGLCGNSFWVALRGVDWYVASWAPRIYRLQAAERVNALCLHLLSREAGGAYWDFDEHIRQAYGLVEISYEYFDRSAIE